MNSISANINDSFFEIYGQFGGFDFRKRLFGSRASQRSSNPCQQLSDFERFHNLIVRAGIQRLNLVTLKVANCHHDDGSCKAGSNLATSFGSAHVWQVEIHENQIGRSCITRSISSCPFFASTMS